VLSSTGTIFKTTDAGLSWFTVPSGTTEALKSIHFADQNTGYVVGSSGTILKTTNAGASWVHLTTPTPGFFLGVYSTDVNTEYIIGGDGFILKSGNGGGFPVNVEEPAVASPVTIYPNPAENRITISDNRKEPGEKTISILDINGRQILTRTCRNQASINMDVSMLPRGIYVVKIQTKSGIETKKLVIQ